MMVGRLYNDIAIFPVSARVGLKIQSRLAGRDIAYAGAADTFRELLSFFVDTLRIDAYEVSFFDMGVGTEIA